jgi:hypothetical protein
MRRLPPRRLRLHRQPRTAERAAGAGRVQRPDTLTTACHRDKEVRATGLRIPSNRTESRAPERSRLKRPPSQCPSASTSARILGWAGSPKTRVRARVAECGKCDAAEQVGRTAGVRFELTEPVKAQRFSRPPRSTAPAPRRAAFKVPPTSARVRRSGGQVHRTRRAAPAP